eukprot:jgi/Ulvmu1/1549/UM110_0012.1
MATNAVNAPVLDPNDPSDRWLMNLDTSHIKPLGDDWQNHPYWADDGDLAEKDSNLAKVAEEMSTEDTPEQKAENCKNTGNNLIRQGKQRRAQRLLRTAIEKYAEGLGHLNHAHSNDTALRCALQSNQAQAHALLGNWRNSLQSARAAIQTDSKHFKSYMRAATAAARLREWRLLVELCSDGLALEPDSPELLSLQKDAEREQEAQRRRELAQRAAQAERVRPLRRVARCITARGYAMTRPQFGFQKNTGAFLPWLEEGAAAGGGAATVPPLGALHFPALLYYPEASPYHDTIEDVCETDTIGDHLDTMFGEGAPPIGWDEAGAYTRQRVRLFYCSFCGTALREGQIVECLQEQFPSGYVESGCQKYGPKTSAMVPVPEDITFAELLTRPDHVMPGVPVLFVVPHGTAFYDRFLKSFDPHGR